MKFPPGSRVLTLDEVALAITVAMAADSRHAPVLRGAKAERDPVERDRIRREFARWVAQRLLAANVTVVEGPPSEGAGGMAWGDVHRRRGCRACSGAVGHA